ncbi:unnamed protein product [Schistosoma mattheei]|uniref:Uncharacterized protein n=1 Tax=Schistosoma mattheei TaxID=31246 RepID=A0A3P8GF77_9TREM|nr:unnamed protein product [Schistosoma mattheei]
MNGLNVVLVEQKMKIIKLKKVLLPVLKIL